MSPLPLNHRTINQINFYFHLLHGSTVTTAGQQWRANKNQMTPEGQYFEPALHRPLWSPLLFSWLHFIYSPLKKNKKLLSEENVEMIRLFLCREHSARQTVLTINRGVNKEIKLSPSGQNVAGPPPQNPDQPGRRAATKLQTRCENCSYRWSANVYFSSSSQPPIFSHSQIVSAFSDTKFHTSSRLKFNST